jgi:hypothetical protein
MKTTPQALRRQAGLVDRRDDPDTVAALWWAAADIEELEARIAELERALSATSRSSSAAAAASAPVDPCALATRPRP